MFYCFFMIKKVNKSKKKEILVWSTIGAVMTVIFVFWSFNLRARMQASAKNGEVKRDDLAAISESLNTTMTQMREQMEAIRDYASSTEASRAEANELSKTMLQQALQSASSSVVMSTSTLVRASSSAEIKMKQDNIEKLKERLTN